MAFQNNMSQAVDFHFEEQQQKEQLLADLAKLQTAIEEGEKRVAELTVTEEEVNRAKDLLAQAEAEVKRVQQAIQAHSSELEGIQAQLEAKRGIEVDIEGAKQEPAAVVSKNSEAEASFESAQRRAERAILDLETRKASLTDEVATLVAEVDKLSTQKERKTSEVETLSSESEQLTEGNAALKQENKELAEANQSAKAELADQRRAIEILTDSHARKIDDLEAEYQERRVQLEESLAQVKEQLTEREGDLSKRESILEEKTEQLRSFKAELEKHYNRTININI